MIQSEKWECREREREREESGLRKKVRESRRKYLMNKKVRKMHIKVWEGVLCF